MASFFYPRRISTRRLLVLSFLSNHLLRMAVGGSASNSGGIESSSANPQHSQDKSSCPVDSESDDTVTCIASSTSNLVHLDMLKKIQSGDGFFAALDQSGGSTPKALRVFGILDTDYVIGEESMYLKVHEMRTRIITSPSFHGDKVLGAILFENTLNRTIEAIPTGRYLWERKHIVPFLKVDVGLEESINDNGVQLMKPIPNLHNLLQRAKDGGIFGTKMRSVIHQANEVGIEEIVHQQFTVAKQILSYGLVPIIEPEVNIDSPDKEDCENILKAILLQYLTKSLHPNEKVILKLSLPSMPNQYIDLIHHPNVLLVVALSGGYSRQVANQLLSRNTGMIASFSRALTENLYHGMSNEEFDDALQDSINSIYDASKAG